MALLQISEPGQSLDPHQRKNVLGIDLGTTHSLVATFKNGAPHTLADEQGRDIIPSIVRYTQDKVEVGFKAQQHLVDDANNTILSIKRLMGRGIEDLKGLQQQLPYRFVKEQAGETQRMPSLKTDFTILNPVEVSAEILKHLSALGRAHFDAPIDGAVITVPAYFDEAQRQATKDAARLADINVLRLLNEPTAAAIAYGLEQHDDEYIAVYDLGGGTFDISILHLSKGVFQVQAIGGDSALGGDDFDLSIAEYLLEQFMADASTRDIQRLSLAQQRELTRAAKHAKEQLSSSEQVTLDLRESFSWQGVLTRPILEQCIAQHIAKTLKACQQALDDAELEVTDIDRVVMVGGSTRVPSVLTAVEKFFKTQPYCALDPDKVVALGAAIQADILAGNRQDDSLLLLDVVPLSLGVETVGGLMDVIIKRNTPIPVTKAQEFTTYQDGQTAMSIHVLQGERDLIEDCRSLGRFELRGIPPMVAGAARITVTFQIDADGLLEVSAREEQTGKHSQIQVKPAYGLSDEEVMEMLEASFSHANEDKDARHLRQLQVEAEQLHTSVQAAFAEDAKLLDATETASLMAALAKMETARHQAQSQILQEAIETLSTASELLAARRMNKAIHEALAGTHIDQLEQASD